MLVAVASTNNSCGTSASGNSSTISMNRSSTYGGNTTSNLGRWCWGRRGQQSMECICCHGKCNNNNHGDRNISVMLVLAAVTVAAIEIW